MLIILRHISHNIYHILYRYISYHNTVQYSTVQYSTVQYDIKNVTEGREEGKGRRGPGSVFTIKSLLDRDFYNILLSHT